MEFTQHNLPTEWEEQWRREKERKRRIIEEGGEGIKQDDRELRRIVAYNDSRMGLTRGRGERESLQDRMRYGSGTSEEDTGERKDIFQDRNEGLDKVHTYHCEAHPNALFMVLKKFWDSSVLTDMTLSTENGKYFHVHSPVLAAVSSLIRDKLTEESGLSTDTCVDVHRLSVSLGPEVHHVGLQAVLEFAYTGAVLTLNKDSVAQIKAAAETLGSPRVVDLCNKEEKMEEGGSTQNEEGKVSALEQININLQSIRQLWRNTIGCDVILDVDGSFFHVHRVILAASSDYFRGMFTCGMRESHQTCVALPILLAHELETLIGCSYSGSLPLSWECVFEITCTALQLQFQPAISLCHKFLHHEMEVSSCLDVASFAEAYSMTELLEEANEFVLRNFWEVSTTVKFQDLPAEKLLDYLLCDALCVPSELAVFRAVIFWIEADPEQRLSQASALMTGVRFPLMTFREFREVRAVNLRLECIAGGSGPEVELYSSALKEFGFSLPKAQDQCRVRRPKDALVLVGGDQLNSDMGQRMTSRELWFVNSLRSGTGLVKDMEWRKLSELPDMPRFRHGVAVMEGHLYVMGGCEFYSKDNTLKSVYRYDSMQDCWKKIADMQEFRSNFSVVVQEERLYAIGGDKELNSNTDSVEMYNPGTDSWSYVQPLEQALSGHAVAVVDGGFFISGGFNSRYVCLVSMFLYHPQRGTTHLADMTSDRAQHCMEALRGHLYVAGGVCNLRSFYADQKACEVYDPDSDSWSAFTPLPLPHVGAASAVLEEKIYVLGGYCQDDYSESGLVHRYNLSPPRWENMGKMPGAVTDIQACLLRLPQHLRTVTDNSLHVKFSES
ncbi:kelch-like protein 33 [Genypterus blacodes]|uniref:kelch-like protein 33 n=1 Tax=Genypterus blacodes TaxID=154954 RepID=UPI003F765F57